MYSNVVGCAVFKLVVRVRENLRAVACLFAHGNVYVVRVPGLLVVIFVSICVP